MELPPHARRILFGILTCLILLGTTSACAENTFRDFDLLDPVGNYLRMRGEYALLSDMQQRFQELPPHARRILHHLAKGLPDQGTTSACAENTGNYEDSHNPWRNYLRMRGEYSVKLAVNSAIRELPPHARRILLNKPSG